MVPGERVSARLAAKPPEPARIQRRVKRIAVSRSLYALLLEREVVGLSSSYLHPQLVTLMNHYGNRGTPPLVCWCEDAQENASTDRPRLGLTVVRLLSEVSTPLSVAAQWLKLVADAITTGEGSGVVIDRLHPFLLECIRQWCA